MVKYSQEKIEALGLELGKAFSRSQSAKETRQEWVDDWRRQYDGILSTKPEPWMCNVNIPLTKHMINAAAVQIGSAVFGSEPYCEVESNRPELDEYAPIVEQFMQTTNANARLKIKGQLAIKDALITGSAWIWSRIERNPDSKIDFTADSVDINNLDVKLDYSVVTFEDMMLLPFNAQSFKHARGAFARKWLSWSDIMQAQKAGKFSATAVDALRAQWGRERSTTLQEDEAGVDAVTPETIWDAQFECWEGIYRWVAPGADVAVDHHILLYYPSDAGGGNAVVLTCQPYEEVFGTKRWFFFPIMNNPRLNTMWPPSMCDDIEGLQKHINAAHQMSADAIQINIAPPIAVGSAGLNKDYRWGPMERWDVSPGDVQVMGGNANQLAAVNAAMGSSEFARAFAERITGVTDVSTGRPNEEKRTAFEINAVINSGSQLFEYQVGFVQLGADETQGMEALYRFQMELMAAFMPELAIEFRPGGTNTELQVIPPDALRGSYALIPHGSSMNYNPQVRMQRSQMLLQTLQQSPFTAVSPMDTPDTVLDKMQRFHRAYMDLVQNLGIKHPESYIGGEPSTIEEAMALAAILYPDAVGLIIQQAQAQAVPQPGMQQPGAEQMPGYGAAIPTPADMGDGANGQGAQGVSLEALAGLQGANPIGGMETTM